MPLQANVIGHAELGEQIEPYFIPVNYSETVIFHDAAAP